MIQVTPQTKIFVATNPIDFRCGIESLGGICKKKLLHDPFSGAYFAFTNKRRTGLKLLVFDGQGFWCMHKRLSQGRLRWWPDSQDEVSPLDTKNFLLLLFNGEAEKVRFQEDWRKI